jgi:hypothetical protein
MVQVQYQDLLDNLCKHKEFVFHKKKHKEFVNLCLKIGNNSEVVSNNA